MTSPLDPIKEALGRFSSSDDDVRELGFSVLVKRSTPFLHALLASSRLSEADREDVIQDVFHRVWKSRQRLEFPNVGSWWRWLRTTASRCMLDAIRSREPSSTIDDFDLNDIPEDEVAIIDDLIELIEDRRRLYRLADEVFLGVSTELPERERNRQMLAAKLLLIDKLPWQTVCRLLNAGSSEDVRVRREDIDEWLASPALLQSIAYVHLHWENDRLCDYLLAGHLSISCKRESTSLAPWTPEEVIAIKLRYRNTILLDQIVSRMSGRMTKSELVSIFDRCTQRFPFIEIVRRLNSDFDFGRQSQEQLSAPGLWQRLVFQYYANNGLPHRDILDRTADAAKEAGYVITMGMLNVGLSNGRLFKRLADHLALKEANEPIQKSAR